MSNTVSSLDRITELKAQIAALEQGAIAELYEKRNALSHELAAVDAEIARLTGKSVEAKKSRATTTKGTVKPAGKSPSLQELKELLAAAPQKTIGVRKEGYDLQNIKTLAKANPQLLQLGGKAPWPTVTLLK